MLEILHDDQHVLIRRSVIQIRAPKAPGPEAHGMPLPLLPSLFFKTSKRNPTNHSAMIVMIVIDRQ